MQDLKSHKTKKAVGGRIKHLRKQRGWTQKELTKYLECSYQQLNKYESGIHAPPLDSLAQLADALNVTIDYLITGKTSEEKPINNNRLLQRFKLLGNFETNQQEIVITVIDAMVAKHQMEETLKTLDKRN